MADYGFAQKQKNTKLNTLTLLAPCIFFLIPARPCTDSPRAVLSRILQHTPYLVRPPCTNNRVPRGIEKRVRDWVRFQYTEAQQEKKVSLLPCVRVIPSLLLDSPLKLLVRTNRRGRCFRMTLCLRNSSWPLQRACSMGSSPRCVYNLN